MQCMVRSSSQFQFDNNTGKSTGLFMNANDNQTINTGVVKGQRSGQFFAVETRLQVKMARRIVMSKASGEHRCASCFLERRLIQEQHYLTTPYLPLPTPSDTPSSLGALSHPVHFLYTLRGDLPALEKAKGKP